MIVIQPEQRKVTVELQPVISHGEVVEVPVHDALYISLLFILFKFLLPLLHILRKSGVLEKAGIPNSGQLPFILTVRPGQDKYWNCFYLVHSQYLAEMSL